MSKRREQLIAELAAAVQPVRRPGRTTGPALAWLLVTVTIALGATLLHGPLRPGVLTDLAHAPRYALEAVLGLAACLGLALAAFRSGIPAPGGVLRRFPAAIALLGGWSALFLVALIVPAIEPSMTGKREACLFEVLLYGLPGLALGVLAVRRQWPLSGPQSGALLGLASGAVPALLMQFACMPEPTHALAFHLVPGLVLGVLGAALGAVLLRPR